MLQGFNSTLTMLDGRSGGGGGGGNFGADESGGDFGSSGPSSAGAARARLRPVPVPATATWTTTSRSDRGAHLDGDAASGATRSCARDREASASCDGASRIRPVNANVFEQHASNKLDTWKDRCKSRHATSIFRRCIVWPQGVSDVARAAARCRSRIQLHAFAAMAAFVLGAVQLAAPKGTLPHRTLGMGLGRADAGDQRFVVLDPRHHGCGGPWSPIHLLSVFTPDHAGAWRWWRPARHRVRAHRITMISIFAGALVIAGLFTLVPGRIMHGVLFGSEGRRKRGWAGDFRPLRPAGFAAPQAASPPLSP